jgi:hypothetical protein
MEGERGREGRDGERGECEMGGSSRRIGWLVYIMVQKLRQNVSERGHQK